MIGTLPDWLGYRARTSPHRPALIAGSTTLTFAELDRCAAVVARRLASLGVGEGARVATVLPNGAAYAVLVHALMRLRAILVPLNPRLTASEIAWRLQDASPTVVVGDASAAGAVGGLHVTDPQDPDVLSGVREERVALWERIGVSAVQGIVYTSATAGHPKGAMLTYGNHWWSAVASALNLGVHVGDRWLAVLPLSHIGGLAILWRSVIYGHPVVIHQRFDPQSVSEELDRGEVTVLSLVPTMLHRLLDARGDRPLPQSVRAVLLGGGPIPPSLVERSLQAGVPIAPTYGLTEAASQVATLRPEDVRLCPGSCGRPLYPIEVRIRYQEQVPGTGTRNRYQEQVPGTGTRNRYREPGEILVRGPVVMAGYWGRPHETERALRGGWLHTGDIGYLDAEGYLYVLDRRDDLIVTGGENVYPAEVEAVLRAHPAVCEAAVVGLPDEEWGQVVVAAVETLPQVVASEAELLAFCAGRLARHKVPKRVWFVDALPRSGPDKVRRAAVRERLRGAAAE
ncbi:MAG: o-succinylbenzoate--CoA ligase [Armatimonadota bacterium]|nr:o-succinylbenzoate--CoA ligase [Armatimonadota bacterium]